MRELPIYDITLDEENWGIYAISVVENPAIESDFIYMSKDSDGNQFIFADEEKREILGPILIPDVLIYRKVNGQEFYVRFSKETIVEINAQMQKTDGNKYFTVEHELGANGAVQFLESWIKETEEDKSSAFGIDVPIGSLIVKAKVESDLLWDLVKEQKLKGFSVEIDASIIKAELNKLSTNKKDDIMDFDFKTLYSNSLEVEDSTLLFNGDMEVGTVVMNYLAVPSEEEGADDVVTMTTYDGTFTVDNIEWTIKDGLVTDRKDIQLSIEEKLDNVLKAFEKLKTELGDTSEDNKEEDINDKLDTILTKIEEDRLAKAQEGADESTDETDEVTSEFSAEAYRSVGEWFKKWD